MNSKITVTAAAAATIAVGAVYLRRSCKAVTFAFRTGRALGLAERDQDIRVLIHAAGDTTKMLQDAGIWHPGQDAVEEVPAP